MKAEKLKLSLIYEIASIAVMATAILFCVRDLIVWEANDFVLLLFCLLSTGLICCCRYYYKNKLLYLSLGTAVVFVFLLFLIFRPDIKAIVESVVFLELCVSLLVALVSYLIFQNRVVRTVITAIGFLLLILLPFIHVDLSVIAVSAILYLSVFTVVDLYMDYYHKRKKESKDYRSSASFFPFYILPIIVIILIPKSEEPIQWQFVKDFYQGVVKIYQNASDYVENAFTELQFAFDIYPEEYRMNITGYSGQGRLGGDITDNQSKMLLISGKKPAGNTYFMGASSDTYTGYSWEKTVDWSDYKEEYYLDYAEMLHALALSGVDSQTALDNIDVSTLTVTHLNMHTKTLFYPLKVTSIVNYGKSDFTSNGPNIVYDKAVKTKKSGYRVTFMDIDYQSEWMLSMLSNPENYWYAGNRSVNSERMEEIQKELLNVRSNGNIDVNAEQLLVERAAFIKSEYIKLPETLPVRVNELAEEVTKDCNTDYEKMLAIQEYLKNFAYTKTPQEITEGDFVDEFLFTIKEGYCTYFASVMAVMGRCVGVPTRYVEGFFCDYTTLDSPDQYIITSNKGHAWCEFYAEGIGWIPMEATNGCGYTRNYFHASGTVSSSGVVENNERNEKEINEIYDELTQEQEEENANKVDWDRLLKVILLAVGLIAFVVVVWYAWMRIAKQMRYRKASPRDKILTKAAEIFRLLDQMEPNRKEYRTVEGYMTILEQYLEGESSQLKKFYLSARYSEHDVEESTVKVFESAEKRLTEKAVEQSRGFGRIKLRLS